MALIIKGDMPKACNWFDENGKHRFCKVNAFCDCRIYTRGERPSDCPILGEIPDKHGRLVDLDAFLEARENMATWEEYLIEDIDNYFENPSVVVLEAST